MLLAGEVDARVLLVEADRDVGIGLVVAEADVEPRPVALDEALLGEQRLGLGRGHQELDRGRPRIGELELAAGEVRGDPLADRARLADVEERAAVVVEQVDARGVGQVAPLLGYSRGALLVDVLITQRVGSWPHGQFDQRESAST